MTAHRNLGFGAEDGFFELQVDVFAEIGAALGAAAFPRPPAKNFSQAEEVAENIAEILEGIEARRRPLRLTPAWPKRS